MVILIDINVLLDVMDSREPFYLRSSEIIQLCIDKKVRGWIAAHTVPTLFYLLRKKYDEKSRRKIILEYTSILRVSAIDDSKITSALQNEAFTDFEDCLQMECARAVGADYIVTRNTADFAESPVPALSPEEFLRVFGEEM